MSLIKSLASQALDFFETIVLALVIFLLMQAFVAEPHVISGSSMLPNFRNGERIFTQKISYYLHPPQRGDVVVFRYPQLPEREYIKRIVGLPGEEVEIKNGQVFIYNSQNPNGLELKEKYLPLGLETKGKTAIKDGTRFKVEQGKYVTLGDNRGESSDSREWGLVPKNNIIGKVFLRYWPPSAFSIFK